MTEQTNRKRPSLGPPLMMLAGSILGMIVGFGLCAENYSHPNRLADVGIYIFLLCGAGVVLSIAWLIVVGIIRAMKARNR